MSDDIISSEDELEEPEGDDSIVEDDLEEEEV